MMANLICLIVLVICAVVVQGCDPRSGKHPPGSVPLYGRRPPPGSDGAYGPRGDRTDCSRSRRGVPGARGPLGPPGEARERLCEPKSVNRGSPGSRGVPGSQGAPGPAGGVSIDRSSVRLHLLLSSGESPETIFATLDLDEDNYVTLSEWVSEGGDSRAFAMFLDDFDLNNDGKIDFGEARRVAVNLR
ncbi:Collectin-12 [Holothuria leucospilota]|uniref:Collectin-12 n=1 Tax=Holothuria leucospilota TaxID=206669 RepID=A0A9Q1C7Z9_HOLLE|nr:Collectin-12 [Holothuria leucospilota]